MKKLFLIMIFAMVTVSCGIIDEYNEAKQEAAEREMRCYRKYNGNVYCEDRDGNRM